MDGITTTPRARSGNSDIMLAVGLVGLLFVLLVPLPPMVLDLLLVVNLACSVLVLLLVLSSERPLELSTFPTLLLFASLLRLALNVASTRLILLNGKAGQVIQSFGEFVVGGSLIVGVVVFFILVVIQFVVITKGAGRISEVAARFTLDAMPGKQMAIDADLNGGLITPEEAKERRKDISREAEFYGAMDGASKFVRGDAIAGLLITAVNILGGVAVAMLQNGMTIGQAFTTYTILTVGDGLVSQIPALIVATAGAIIVTKASNEADLATELHGQLTERRRGLLLAAAIIGLLGLVPGLPLLPFLLIASIMVFLGRRPGGAGEAEAAEVKSAEQGATEQLDELKRLLRVDPMGIELGYRLLFLVESGPGGGLLKHVAQLRKRFASELGLLVPPIRVTDNVRLAPNGYRILFQGQRIASGTLQPGHLLAMNPGGATDKLEGEPTVEPTFGLPALWVAESRRSEADLCGYTVVEPVSVMVTHLSETIRGHAAEILTRDDVKSLVEAVREERPAVVDDLIPNLMSYGDVHQVLRELLQERVSVRNLPAILEVLSENAATTKDPKALAELTRQRLRRALLEPYLDESGKLRVVTLDPALERSLMEIASHQEGAGNPGMIKAVVERVAEEVRRLVSRGQEAVVLVRGEIRSFMRDLLQGVGQRAAVVSYAEASAAPRIEAVAVVSPTASEEVVET